MECVILIRRHADDPVNILCESDGHLMIFANFDAAVRHVETMQLSDDDILCQIVELDEL